MTVHVCMLYGVYCCVCDSEKACALEVCRVFVCAYVSEVCCFCVFVVRCDLL